jgi:hypothetical protein
MDSSSYSIADIESFCARMYQGKNLLITPYAYNTTFLALAQNASATNVIQIAANADFIALGFRHRAQIGAAQTVQTITEPFVRMLVTDSGSNEQFTAAAVDLNNYSCNGGQGVLRNLPYPRVLAGRSSITVAVTNYAPTAETYTSLDIFLEGVLVRAIG